MKCFLQCDLAGPSVGILVAYSLDLNAEARILDFLHAARCVLRVRLELQGAARYELVRVAAKDISDPTLVVAQTTQIVFACLPKRAGRNAVAIVRSSLSRSRSSGSCILHCLIRLQVRFHLLVQDRTHCQYLLRKGL